MTKKKDDEGATLEIEPREADGPQQIDFSRILGSVVFYHRGGRELAAFVTKVVSGGGTFPLVNLLVLPDDGQPPFSVLSAGYHEDRENCWSFRF